MRINQYSTIFLAIGLFFMVASIVIISVFGLRLGVDFTGGALNEVSYDVRPDRSVIEESLTAVDLGTFTVRETIDEAGRDGYIVRTSDLTDEERQTIEAALLADGEGAALVRFTSVGPVIGQELRDKAVWAIGAVVLIIVLYVAYAFSSLKRPVSSWVYGGVTVFTLIHDLLVPVAAMSLLGAFLGVEIDTLFIMAILAALGYSVNDTIVIFDRVRENILKYQTEQKKRVKNIHGVYEDQVEYELTRPFGEIVDDSVRETLGRSINTSLTTSIVLLTLYLFGGTVTQTFAFVLLVGVVVGTYSSLFFASPLLILIAKRQAKKEAAA